MTRAGRPGRRMAAGTVAVAVLAGGLVALPAGPGAATQSWSPVAEISVDDAMGSDLAVSADGSRAVVAYARRGPADVVMHVRTSTDGGATWGAATALGAAGGESDTPSVGISADGRRILVAWTQFPAGGGDARVQVRTSTDGGGTWSATVDASDSAASCFGPDVHLATDGARAAAVWRCRVGPGAVRAVVAGSPDGGASWHAPVAVSVPGIEASDVDVAGSADATRAVAVWTAGTVPTRVQSVATQDGGATWGPVRQVGADAMAVSRAEGMVASSDGSRVAVSATRLGGDGLWQAQVVTTADGGVTWRDPVPLSGAGLDAPKLVTASSADGTRLVSAWSEGAGGSVAIASRTSSDGGLTWGTTTRLADPAALNDEPRVVMSADGRRAVAAWCGSADGATELLRARSSADGGATWGVVGDVSAAADSITARLAQDASGTLTVATWESLTGPTVRVLGATHRITPSAGAVTPATGPAAGGTSVTITGSDLVGVTAVGFGGTPAASFTVADDGRITAVTPAHTGGGAVDVVLTSPTGSSTLPGAFTYQASAPVVATAPGTVGSLRVRTARRGRATVRWTAPASDGGAAVTGYRLRVSRAGRVTTYRAWRTVTATQRRLTGLRRGARYAVQVRAVNAVGAGPVRTVRFRASRR